MTAVSQSYPNYLGGLNEQPDEIKKPGQLVEAQNVIPDPTIGLVRRPGFQLVNYDKKLNTATPNGTWFDFGANNLVNQDTLYFGCINPDNGKVEIINQDGEKQRVVYCTSAISPHKDYEYKSGKLTVRDDNGEVENKYETQDEPKGRQIDYFMHNDREGCLKYVSSKNHVVITNPREVPSMSRNQPSEADKNKYYSFIDLKVVDTQNYNYIFTLFGDDTQVVSYREIVSMSIEEVSNMKGDLSRDESAPLQDQSPKRFTIDEVYRDGDDSPTKVDEACIFEVVVRSQVVQSESSSGSFNNNSKYNLSLNLITGGKGFKDGDEIRCAFDTIRTDEGADVTVQMVMLVNDTIKVTATDNDAITPNDEGGGDITNMNADDILNGLRASFGNKLNKVVKVGNGLYLEHDEPFSVSSTEIAVADVINSQKLPEFQNPIAVVTDVADLPIKCYDGFLVQVTNSFNGDNDYYLKYDAESVDPDLSISKADGFWIEVAKPYEKDRVNNYSMPHMITMVRRGDQSEFIFIVSKIKWKRRTVGDVDYNPSFVQDNSPITALNYYKNRLIFLTQKGTIVTSRSDDISNLFANTALTTSAVDPIDVIANNNDRVPLAGSAVVNNGLLVFGESEQYMFTTNNDVLTSETVNVTKVANYTFAKDSYPINLGVNIGFLSSGVTRFYETTNLYDRGPIDMNERSQQVQGEFSRRYDQAVSSREQSMAVFYKRNFGGSRGARTIYLYRFRQENSQESSQTSWVTWKLPYDVVHIAMPADKIYVVVDTGKVDDVTGFSKTELYKMDGSTLAGLPAANTPLLNNTPNYLDGWYEDDDGEIQGHKFETRITLPTIYVRNGDSHDVNGNLTIHRVKLSTSATGTYQLNVDRKGYDSYDILVEQAPSDEYRAGTDKYYNKKVETVPIYTRNKNLTLTLTTDYNTSFTLNSMTWEGDYNRPYYKSV